MKEKSNAIITRRLVAVHRFVEVSLGIVVALVLTALWPRRELASGKNPR